MRELLRLPGTRLLRQRLFFQFNPQPIRSSPRTRRNFGLYLYRLFFDEDAPGVNLEDAQLSLRLNRRGHRYFAPTRRGCALYQAPWEIRSGSRASAEQLQQR